MPVPTKKIFRLTALELELESGMYHREIIYKGNNPFLCLVLYFSALGEDFYKGFNLKLFC